MEDKEDSPRIEDTSSPEKKAIDATATEVFPPTTQNLMKGSDENVKSEIVTSKFSETDKRIRYQYRNSRFAEARETIMKYMSEMSQEQKNDLNEASRVYLRYVIVLSKNLDFIELSKANSDLI